MEIWKTIEGFKDYQISNIGNIKTLSKLIKNTYGFSLRKEKIIKKNVSKLGYCKFAFSKEGKRHTFLLHRLVAQAFIPNPENKPCVNHINGIKTDNRVENLEWNTYSENMKHAFKLGLNKYKDGNGENGKNSKLKEYQVLDIRTCFLNRHEYMNKYNISMGCIQGIQERSTWKHI